jgi:hypothetical protein
MGLFASFLGVFKFTNSFLLRETNDSRLRGAIDGGSACLASLGPLLVDSWKANSGQQFAHIQRANAILSAS